MPDCSAVSIVAAAPEGGWTTDLIAALDVAAYHYGWLDEGWHDLTPGSTAPLCFENDETPGGAGDLMSDTPIRPRTPDGRTDWSAEPVEWVPGVRSILLAAGVAWSYTDGGHYTWDGSIESYTDVGGHQERTVGVEGQVLMTRSEFVALVGPLLDDSIVEALADTHWNVSADVGVDCEAVAS